MRAPQTTMPDRFPQPTKYEFTLPNATDLLGQELRFPLVLPRRETESQRIVTEVISVKYDFGGGLAVLNAIAMATASTQAAIRASISYRALNAAENDQTAPLASLGDIAVLDVFTYTAESDGAAAAGFVAMATPEIVVSDLTGGVGVGQIIPGDRLFLNISTNQDLSARVFGLIINYRQHLVGLNEYLGILAAFQQNPS